MAIDKAVDSARLEADLTTVADAIRAKGGTSDALTFPGGFASAISAIATGGGTLGIKSGTMTISESYFVPKIAHGCGKIPYAVIMHPTNDNYKTNTTHTIGFIWFRDSYAMSIRNATMEYLGSMAYGYIVPLEEPQTYGPQVNAEMATINPAQKWEAGTYVWTAIYEV